MYSKMLIHDLPIIKTALLSLFRALYRAHVDVNQWTVPVSRL
jgi:hypothetical protein